MRRTLASITLLLAALPAGAHADEMPVVIGDLRSPESAAWHAPSNSWFVSNMGGVSADLGPDAGFGFISRVPRTGAVTTKWITGLERPRGVAAGPNHLFVAEPNKVVVIDIALRVVKHRITVSGANGDLNDIAFDESTGAVFVSAPNVDTIFKIATPLAPFPTNRVAEVFVQDSELTQPNGLVIEAESLVAVGLGLNNPTGRFGRVVRIDLATKAITRITEDGMGLLDGVVKDGDDYLVTEYVTGNLWRVARDGTQTLVYKLLPGSADLGIDPVRRVIMVPETTANALVTLPILL